MNLLFTYGTLQNETVQIELFGRLLEGHDDQVRGFSIKQLELDTGLVTENRQAYPAALPSSSYTDIISGKVYKVTETELEIADEYETSAYCRISVKLVSGIMAWIYVAAAKRYI